MLHSRVAVAASSHEVVCERCSPAASQLTTPRRRSSGSDIPGSGNIDDFDSWSSAAQSPLSESSSARSLPDASCKQRGGKWPGQRLSISDLSEAERMTPERLAERGLGFPWQQTSLCTVDFEAELAEKCRDLCIVPTPELGKKCMNSDMLSPADRHLTACTLEDRFTEESLEGTWYRSLEGSQYRPSLCSLELSPQLANSTRDFCLLPTPELKRTLKSSSPPVRSSPMLLQQRFAACTHEEPYPTKSLPSYNYLPALPSYDYCPAGDLSSVQQLPLTQDAQMHCPPSWFLGKSRRCRAEETGRLMQGASKRDTFQPTSALPITLQSPGKALPPQKRLRAQARAGGA